MTGAVYIKYESSISSGLEESDAILFGDNFGDSAGASVAIVPDTNDDGYDDLVVGVPKSGNSDIATVVLQYGPVIGERTVSDSDVVIETRGTPQWPFPRLGNSVASASDSNNDGVGDIIIGDKEASNRSGRAYVFFGQVPAETHTDVADIELEGDGSFSQFGWSVSSAGDVNGDGCHDLIVGAPVWDDERGAAYLYYGPFSSGNTLSDVDAAVILQGEHSHYYGEGSWFGTSVEAAGDIDGDGYDDVLVGSRQGENSYNIAGSGSVTLFFGGSTSELEETTFQYLGGDYYYAGYNITAGDVTGDSSIDIAISAEQITSVYLFLGPVEREKRYYFEHSDLAFVEDFPEIDDFGPGISLDMGGDVNQDGKDDLVLATCTKEMTTIGMNCTGEGMNAYMIEGRSITERVQTIQVD